MSSAWGVSWSISWGGSWGLEVEPPQVTVSANDIDIAAYYPIAAKREWSESEIKQAARRLEARNKPVLETVSEMIASHPKPQIKPHVPRISIESKVDVPEQISTDLDEIQILPTFAQAPMERYVEPDSVFIPEFHFSYRTTANQPKRITVMEMAILYAAAFTYGAK